MKEPELKPINYAEDKELEKTEGKIDGRRLGRKTVGDDKALNITASGVADNSVSTAKIVNLAVTEAKLAANAVAQAKLKYEVVNVNVAVGQTQGTGTCTSGSIIIGFYPAGNVDQLVDQISVSGTTITITLAAAATAQNNFTVVLLKS